MGILRKLLVGVIVLALIGGAVVAAFSMGFLGKPTAGLQDYGDWGTVSDQRTEVITTAWVQNPNPIGVSTGGSVKASYQLYLNNINVANGQKSDISIQPGNNTLQISTFIQNKALPPWWVAFVQNNETIPLRVNASAQLSAGSVSSTFEFPSFQQTLLSDSTPVISALSQAAAAAEGNYTKSAQVEAGVTTQSGTIGYEVQRGWATWGSVNEETTTVLFHFQVHNPSRNIPAPAVPDGIGVSVDMNNITMFQAQGEEFSPKNIDGDAVIRPGQTQEVVLEVQMDNDKIDDWFRSHVKNKEQTQIRTRVQLVFNIQGTEFRVPEDGGPSYECQLQTAILIDGQETTTNCGQPSSVTGVTESAETPGSTQTQTESGQRNQRPGTDNSPILTAEQTVITGTQVPTPIQTDTDSTPNRVPTRTETTTRTRRSTLTRTPTPTLTETPTATPTETVTPTPTETTTATPTETETPESKPPNANAEANPSSGQAPLTVEFDGSGSSDPDGTIEEYRWEIEGPTPDGTGETITRRFQSQGEYTATLTVTDDDGQTDQAQVTVTVEGRGANSNSPFAKLLAPILRLDISVSHVAGTMILFPIGLVAVVKGKNWLG